MAATLFHPNLGTLCRASSALNGPASVRRRALAILRPFSIQPTKSAFDLRINLPDLLNHVCPPHPRNDCCATLFCRVAEIHASKEQTQELARGVYPRIRQACIVIPLSLAGRASTRLTREFQTPTLHLSLRALRSEVGAVYVSPDQQVQPYFRRLYIS